MKTVKISLDSIEKVKSFVNTIARFDADFDLVSGRYVIDAKSIMGIFSLDLSKPINLNIHGNDLMDNIVEALKPYIVESVLSEKEKAAQLVRLFFMPDLRLAENRLLRAERCLHQFFDSLRELLFRLLDAR